MAYHIGMIPDGNRRWAKERGLQPWEGHKQGAERAEVFIEWCIDHPDITEITTYGLSEENYKRPARELEELYDLYQQELTKLIEKEKIHTVRVKINFVSTNPRHLPRNLMHLCGRLVRETRDYDNKVLNLLLGYTGQSEIIRSISSPRNRLKNLVFGLGSEDIRHGLQIRTPCDFIIRSGEESEEREARSGFLLWQSAYSEYYHINKYFPDVTEEDFNRAWSYFLNTRRRKGH